MRALRYIALVTLGIAFTIVLLSYAARAETMRASYYGTESGSKTASGERFHPGGLTAAHRTLPFGTRLRVCYRGCVVVRISDRGPARWTKRDLDLSQGAARVIGMTHVGVARVSVERMR